MAANFHFSPRTNRAHEINWRDWTEDSFKEAKESNKLILLSISAVWCHWCHVMDETSYSSESNIALINNEFIPIRIDSDKHPEINRVYNMGGWPSTVMLTPDGDILNGGTYLPENSLHSFLVNTNTNYHLNKTSGFLKISQIQELEDEIINTRAKISEEILSNIDAFIISSYDRKYGGFGTQPKFPYTETLDYLIYRYSKTKDEKLLQILTVTLDNMANGGLYDHIEGGFFRYSTTRDWSIPHYEKMLQDNAELLDIYVKTYQITKSQRYKDVCNGIITYINNNLSDKTRGVFYGSHDADEQYYGLNIEERSKTTSPYIDQTIYTDWNAMMLSSYMRAAYVLDRPELLDIARGGTDWLLNNCMNSENGMCHYYTDSPNVYGILSDQIYMINALINLFGISFDRKYLDNAIAIGDIIASDYYDAQSGILFEDIVKYDFSISAQKKIKSITLNSFCAQTFYRLYDYTMTYKFKELATDIINYFSDSYRYEDIFATSFGKAVIRYLAEPLKITIVGDIQSPEIREMFMESVKNFVPYRIIEVLDKQRDKNIIEQRGYISDREIAGFICKGDKCFEPVYSTSEIVTTINNNQIF